MKSIERFLGGPTVSSRDGIENIGFRNSRAGNQLSSIVIYCPSAVQ